MLNRVREAKNVLIDLGLTEMPDFFTLNHATVCALVDIGSTWGYKKSQSSPCSYGRAFYEYLCKQAKKPDTKLGYLYMDTKINDSFRM